MDHEPAKPANEDEAGDPGEVQRTATTLVSHFGLEAIKLAKRMERESAAKHFATAVRKEIERLIVTIRNDRDA